MNDEKYNKFFKAIVQTGGHKQFLYYLREVLDKKEFQSFITKTRKKYKIPSEGFKDSSELYLYPPTQWTYTKDEGKKKGLQAEIARTVKKYHFPHYLGLDVVSIYIFFNTTDSHVLELANLCEIQELDDDPDFPIVVRISPYASRRDILDFMKKTYSTSISYLQNKHKIKGVKLGQLRKRKDKIRERNKFIYDNLKLPKKELMSLVGKRFGEILDYAYLAKIISNESKRRK